MTAGIRKAALVVSCLSDELIAQVLGRLPTGRAAQIRRHMATLDRTDRSGRRDVLGEFIAQTTVLGNQPLDSGAQHPTTYHLRQPLSAADIDRRIAQELPQVQAAIVALLPPRLGAEVLNGFSAERRVSVVERICDVQRILPWAAADVAEVVGELVGHRHAIPSLAAWNLTTIGDLLQQAAEANLVELGETIAGLRHRDQSIQRSTFRSA